jgi:hypothetical protein
MLAPSNLGGNSINYYKVNLRKDATKKAESNRASAFSFLLNNAGASASATLLKMIKQFVAGTVAPLTERVLAVKQNVFFPNFLIVQPSRRQKWNADFQLVVSHIV